MKIFTSFWLIAFAMCASVSAQNAAFASVVKRFQNEKNFNGVVAVTTNGKVDFIAAAGVADRQNSVPMTVNAKFKIASITKTLTAVLILKLYEQGKLDLNAPFGRYLPEYKGAVKEKATIHHLLTYSSGIPNEPEKTGMTPYKLPLSPHEFIEKYCSGKPDFEPGAKSVYSNTDYIILGQIVEKLSGKTFESALRDEIFAPLAMNDSGLATAKNVVKGLVQSYVFDEKSTIFENDEPYHIENYSSAGAMFSTAADLAKFDAAIFGGRLLKAATLELMLKTNPTLGDAAYGFWGSTGYGNFDEPFYYRPGGILGATSNWLHTMKTGKSVIVLSNTNATNLFEMSEQLYLVAKRAASISGKR